MKYEEAMRALEQIIQHIENEEMDIDDLSTNIKKAKELITLCKDKLTKAEESVKKVMED
ncbi:MAG: exodeoxyribonuclease VII small subunit [Prevotellaceae bacterium]|nr:exodeoxyribonuclease VII small subunit [Prevotellaceae bacterium]